MAKDTYYFSHDYNARNDEKILELRAEYGAEGYGIFWMIIETMAENNNAGLQKCLIGGLSLSYGIAKGKLSAIIDTSLKIELFYENEGFIFSKRLITHKESIKEYKKERSESGKIGADKRWGKNGSAIANDSKGKETKVKEMPY